MNDIQILTITFAVMSCVWVCLFSLIFYICGKQKGEKNVKKEFYDMVIKEILGEMYIDESGNNVLEGGDEEYERKWKYQIGHNYGLQKAIRIIKKIKFLGNER